MNHFQLARFFWIVLLLIGCTSRYEVDDALSADAKRMKFPDLRQEPLAPAVSLTADYFRQSYPHLTPEQFQQKWRNAQKSRLLFLRSFVNTWYDEISRISSTGPIGPCFGDPHPENFGYLDFAGTLEYSFNDFDDSGACPVLFDALRYFTSLRMMLRDEALESELRRAYVHFLNGEEWVERPSREEVPDTSAILEVLLQESTIKGKIKPKDGHKPLSPAKAQALLALLQKAGVDCADCRGIDASQIQVNMGGSAGLERYWLLVETPSRTQQLIEFKELTEPASQRGPWAQKQKISRAEIMAEIWGKKTARYFAFVNWEGRPFLMRNRLHFERDLNRMDPERRKAFLKEQVYLLAQLHKKTLSGSTLLEEWLGRQSEFQARRYSEALLAAQGA